MELANLTLINLCGTVTRYPLFPAYLTIPGFVLLEPSSSFTSASLLMHSSMTMVSTRSQSSRSLTMALVQQSPFPEGRTIHMFQHVSVSRPCLEGLQNKHTNTDQMRISSLRRQQTMMNYVPCTICTSCSCWWADRCRGTQCCLNIGRISPNSPVADCSVWNLPSLLRTVQ